MYLKGGFQRKIKPGINTAGYPKKAASYQLQAASFRF
jgi:hypothetical protein